LRSIDGLIAVVLSGAIPVVFGGPKDCIQHLTGQSMPGQSCLCEIPVQRTTGAILPSLRDSKTAYHHAHLALATLAVTL
jgi:hypothetical protein